MKARCGIVLSSYNRPRGLQAAIDSLTAQTFTDWACIIADDHSEDPEVASVIQRAQADPRIRGLRGHHRFTAEEKRRTCTLGLRINEAQEMLRLIGCDYYCYLLDDVVYHPGRIAEHVRILDDPANAGAFLVWGEQWLVELDAEGKVALERRQVPEEGLHAVGMPYLRQRLAVNNFINHCSATHRKTPERWSTRGAVWQYVDLEYWRALVAAGHSFIKTGFVGETMTSTPRDIGPSMHHRGETIADIARARGGR